MKKVFVKGFALLAVVALSFANISCEQKAEETVETTEEGVEGAEAAPVEETAPVEAAPVEAAPVEGTEAAPAEGTETAPATEAPATEEAPAK